MTIQLYIFIPNLIPPDVTDRLLQINPSLAAEARKVLDVNKSERHIRGGLATRGSVHNIFKIYFLHIL